MAKSQKIKITYKHSYMRWIPRVLIALFCLAALAIIVLFSAWIIGNILHQKSAKKAFASAQQRCGKDPIAIVEADSIHLENSDGPTLSIHVPSDKDYPQYKEVYDNGFFSSAKVAYYSCTFDNVFNEIPLGYANVPFVVDGSVLSSEQDKIVANYVASRLKASGINQLYAPSTGLPGLRLLKKSAHDGYGSYSYTYNYATEADQTETQVGFRCLTIPGSQPSTHDQVDYVSVNGESTWSKDFGITACTLQDNTGKVSQSNGNLYMNSLAPISVDELSSFTVSLDRT